MGTWGVVGPGRLGRDLGRYQTKGDRVNGHYLSQAVRFVRLTALAFLTSWAATGNSLHTDVLIGAIVGAAEVAYRELVPVS